MGGVQKIITNPVHNIFKNGKMKITYGYMDDDYGGNHYGADIINKDGSGIIVAPCDGTITYVKKSVKGTVDSPRHVDALGNNIKMRISDSEILRFCHLSYNSIQVVKGQKVKKGDILGLLGNTGYTIGAHVHFEYEVYGIRLNPEIFIGVKKDSIQVGDWVKVRKNSLTYSGHNLQGWVTNEITKFKVLEISGNRAVIGNDKGEVTTAIHIDNLIK